MGVNFQRGRGGGGGRNWGRGRSCNNNRYQPQQRGPRQPQRQQDPFAAPSFSFGNIEFQTDKAKGQRGGGVRELNSLLRESKRRQRAYANVAGTATGEEQRKNQLVATAMRRAAGERVRDDPKRLQKTLAKRRAKKRQSAKKWAKRKDALQDSVTKAVEDRIAGKKTKAINTKNPKAASRGDAKKYRKKEKAAKKATKEAVKTGRPKVRSAKGGKRSGGGGSSKGKGKGKGKGAGRKGKR